MFIRHHSCFPVPIPRLTLSHRLANLLLTPAVQTINFRFGHVHVFPSHFRAVAAAVRAGTLSVAFDPVRLATEGSLAEYDSGNDTFSFQSDMVMETAGGRATAVHEASHACADFRNRDTAIRHEEGAAHICEAWYLLNCGIDPTTAHLPANVIKAATDMRDRALPSVPVRATGTEINTVRRDMANLKYENAFYDNDGI